MKEILKQNKKFVHEKAYEIYQVDNVKEWLEGFEDTKESVRKTVELLRNHPLIPETITIEGAVIDTETGRLEPAE